MATTVALVRHGSHDSLGRVLCGRMDGVHLSETGLSQARRLALSLVRRGLPAAIYSSPQPRAQETAAPLADIAGLPVQSDAGLDEIEFGLWQGRSFDELAADAEWQRWNRHRHHACPPNGEGMDAVQRRVLASLETYRRQHPEGLVLAFSHADVIKAALCGVLGLTLAAHDRLAISPASCSTVVLWQGGSKVHCMNETPADDPL